MSYPIGKWCSHNLGLPGGSVYPSIEPYPARNLRHVTRCAECWRELLIGPITMEKIRELRTEGYLCADKVWLWKQWDDDWRDELIRAALWNMSADFLKSSGYSLEVERRGVRLSTYVTTGRKIACATDLSGNRVFIRSVPMVGTDELSNILRFTADPGVRNSSINHTMPIIETLRYEPEFCLDRKHDRAFIIMPQLQENWLFFIWISQNRGLRMPRSELSMSSVRNCLDTALQCIEGLHFMHSHNVTHSDIHLRNIMWAPDESRPSRKRWYFIDFDFSRYLPLSAERRITTDVINMGFCPPERIRRPFDPFLDDVYATGMFLHYYLQSPNQQAVMDFACPALGELIADMTRRKVRLRIDAATAYARVQEIVALTLDEKKLDTMVPFPVVDSFCHPDELTETPEEDLDELGGPRVRVPQPFVLYNPYATDSEIV